MFNSLTYSRETGFSFSDEKVGGFNWSIGASDKIDRVSKFYNSLSFGAKQNALRQIFFALWFFKDLSMKIANWIFFNFLWFWVGSKKGVYLCLFEHADTRKHVYEHSCVSVRVLWRILAHVAHLAQIIFFYFKCNKLIDILIHV